jgi:hypothetical protein
VLRNRVDAVCLAHMPIATMKCKTFGVECGALAVWEADGGLGRNARLEEDNCDSFASRPPSSRPAIVTQPGMHRPSLVIFAIFASGTNRIFLLILRKNRW